MRGLKKVTRKLSVISLLFFILLITLSGCNSSKSSTAKVPSIAEIIQKIKQATDISSMRIADAAGLKKLYDINSTELDDFALFTAPSNIKSDEIAIFKVKDSSNIESIKDKVTKRIDKQAKSFSGYLPDEYYLIQHNIVKVNGNYVIFVISKDAEKVSNAFDEAFK